MKLPALWIVAAFAAGILAASRWPGSRAAWLAATVVVTILLSVILVWRGRMAMAWAFALVAWAALGGLAQCAERAAVPANHVASLIAAGRVDTSEPLRWRGRLREDPTPMPWGRRYVMDLEEVEAVGEALPVRGGLRFNLYGEHNRPDEEANAMPALRAGDRVEALVRVRPPRNFLDPGAFDLHGYLAHQKIDLAGSLRSGELLQLIDRPPPTFTQRLAECTGACWRASMVCSPGSPNGWPYCGRWCSATGALWIRASSRHFKRRRHITFWWLRDCTWGHSWCFSCGSAAGCDSPSRSQAF
jgi:hypothetical protein